MSKKQELQKELLKLEKEHKKKEKSMKENPEYIEIEKEEKRSSIKENKLWKKQDKIKKEIILIYLYEGEYPIYRQSYWSNRNIREEVLSSIKRTYGITNLSHLRAKDIEEITQKLIDLEIKKNEEYRKSCEEHEKTEEEQEEISKKENKFKEELDDLRHKKWGIANKLSKIEEVEREAKEKNPEELKKIKKWKKEKEAQKKIKDINLEELRLEIIKDKIVNNLEDE